MEEILEEANRGAAEYGMKMTEELQQKHREHVAAFLSPVTEKDRQRVRLFEERKAGFSQG